MKLWIELRCILFPLIILQMFLQLHWSPLMVNLADWKWLGKTHTCLFSQGGDHGPSVSAPVVPLRGTTISGKIKHSWIFSGCTVNSFCKIWQNNLAMWACDVSCVFQSAPVRMMERSIFSAKHIFVENLFKRYCYLLVVSLHFLERDSLTTQILHAV